jgi:hypothetical protein
VIGPLEGLGPGLLPGLAVAPPAGEATVLGDGVGLGLAQPTTTVRTIAVAAPPVHLIVQRYASAVPSDPDQALACDTRAVIGTRHRVAMADGTSDVRRAEAAWLDVDPGAFDVERE